MVALSRIHRSREICGLFRKALKQCVVLVRRGPGHRDRSTLSRRLRAAQSGSMVFPPDTTLWKYCMP